MEDVYWTFSYSLVNNESGKPAGVFVTCTETTEKVTTYRKIEETKNELEFAIKATDLGTWDYNPITNKFTSNDQLIKWFGLPQDEQVSLVQVIHSILDSDRQKVRDAIQTALDFSSGGNYDIEYTIVHPVTKTETIVHAKGRAWFSDEKTAYRFNGTLEDITDKATAAKKIKESEERYHQLIYSSPSAIAILCGKDLIITIANDAIIEIWGKGKEVIGKPYFGALPELEEQGYKEIFAQVYDTGTPHNSIETPVSLIQEGKTTLKYCNFILYPQRNVNDIVEGIGIIATEVTSQAILNKQIQEREKQYRELSFSLEEKVAERTLELNNKNADLEKMNNELKAFAYISSHDLQEPLRKIQTFASHIVELENQNLSVKGKDYFKRIQDSALRMQMLIKDLLAYSRTNTSERKHEIVDLNKVVEEIKSDLQEELEQKNARIEAINLCDVSIIHFQFRQLLYNLISNSLKFANPSRPAVISIKSETRPGSEFKNDNLSRNTKYCHISISDNGIGFEQKYSDKIFELFQRLHGRQEYEGTGIGLAIVKKIVENHNGFIIATGEPNKGAAFDIFLPQISAGESGKTQ